MSPVYRFKDNPLHALSKYATLLAINHIMRSPVIRLRTVEVLNPASGNRTYKYRPTRIFSSSLVLVAGLGSRNPPKHQGKSRQFPTAIMECADRIRTYIKDNPIFQRMGIRSPITSLVTQIKMIGSD